MGLSKILKLFVPKDKVFYPLFIEEANNLNSISDKLILLMQETNLDKQLVIISDIKEDEKKGDKLTRQIFEALNKSFITPFDREDIQELAYTIDDVADLINKIAERVQLYKPKKFLPSYLSMSLIIKEAIKEISISINELEYITNKEIIKNSCQLINELENKCDDMYHQGISELFNDEKDTIELIKNKEILEVLEKTTDKIEDVSDVIKTILVKSA
jgi:predicted phosphate transport protein (TIGR00153 family)